MDNRYRRRISGGDNAFILLRFTFFQRGQRIIEFLRPPEPAPE